MSKYFKALDFMMAGSYVIGLISGLISGNYIMVLMLTFMLLHFFPLVYMLRKHGYLRISDEFGYIPTIKGMQEIDRLIIKPVISMFRKSKKLVNLSFSFLALVKYLLVLYFGAMLYQALILYTPFSGLFGK